MTEYFFLLINNYYFVVFQIILEKFIRRLEHLYHKFFRQIILFSERDEKKGKNSILYMKSACGA